MTTHGAEVYGKAIDDAATKALEQYEKKHKEQGTRPSVKELLAFCDGFAAGWMAGYMYQGKEND